MSKNLYFECSAAVSRIFVFLLTCAAEKLLVSENRLISGFQGRVGGIGGSRAQSENLLDFWRAAFPPRERRLCRHSQTACFGLNPKQAVLYIKHLILYFNLLSRNKRIARK